MEAVSPVVPGNEKFEVVIAKDQPEYLPLPVLNTQHGVMSRWRLSPEERKHIADGGDLFVCQLNFSGPLQPIMPIADTPDAALAILVELAG